MELNSLKDTQRLSKKISKIIRAGDIIFLFGDIGVGKTTFARFLINHLQVKHKIKKKAEQRACQIAINKIKKY